MNIRKHIPNALTCGNLLCGCVGIYAAQKNQIDISCWMIYTACLFDFFDGFAARALKVASPIGKDLDSLADMVSFGVLPAFILMHVATNVLAPSPMEGPQAYFHYLVFLIPVFSALRLAKFNNDTRQSDKFIGLPTPANALFISGLPSLLASSVDMSNGAFYRPLFYLTVVLLSYLLIAELPLIALKFKNYTWADNKMRYLLIISAILALLTLNLAAIPIIIILYIILSIIENRLLANEKVG